MKTTIEALRFFPFAIKEVRAVAKNISINPIKRYVVA